MKYSEELHKRVLQRIHDQGEVISFGTPLVECLLDEITRLQEERRWIPVSERLPKKKGEYLTVTEGARNQYGDVSIWVEPVEFYSECGHWGCGIDRFVTHWMPLHMPPKGEK